MALMALTACHSYHVDSTIENRTGETVQLLEVDYPSASFGTDRLAPGAEFHYRFQIEGSGPLKLQYTAPGDRQVHIDGPNPGRAPGRPALDRAATGGKGSLLSSI